MWETWRHQINMVIHKHGRLIIGTTVLFCFVCGYALYTSSWEEVERIGHKDVVNKDRNGSLNRNEHYKDTSYTKDFYTKDNYKKELPDKNHDDTPTKLVFSVRDSIRPYALQDPFTMTMPGKKGGNTTEIKPKKMLQESKDIESIGDIRVRTKLEEDLYNQKKGVPSVISSKNEKRNTSKDIQLKGIILGDTNEVLLTINHAFFTLHDHDMVDGVQLLRIEEERVLVSVEGNKQWLYL